MIYCGIGSRKAPKHVLDLMTKIGESFAKKGLLLRSGGAIGADTAFERGCNAVNGKKEIYYPKKKKFFFSDSHLDLRLRLSYENILEQFRHPCL